MTVYLPSVIIQIQINIYVENAYEYLHTNILRLFKTDILHFHNTDTFIWQIQNLNILQQMN